MTVLSEFRMQAPAVGRYGWDASNSTRLALAGSVIFMLLVGANLATPLYPLLQQQLGLSAFGTSAAFTSYVVALVAALVAAGHWSDHIGRRAALLLAVLVGLAGGAVFATAGNLAMLCVGRALQGIAVALATGASSAALRELLPSRPEWASRFTLLASAGGVAAGPLLGGLLSLLPGATSAPYVVHSLVLLGLLVPLYVLKAHPAINAGEASGRDARQRMRALAPRLPAVSREARGAFWFASAVGFLSFGVFGFCLSLAPGYFAQSFGFDSRVAIGALAGLTLGASALSQFLNIRGRAAVVGGLMLLAASVALLPVAAAHANIALLVAASITAGLGQGVAFRTAFNAVAGKVEAANHARIISSVYVITYLGSAIPVLGLGWAAGLFGLALSISVFAGLCAAVAMVLAAIACRNRQ
ncbi:MFS transporter [Pseudarthrobacter sp. J75]|uniref:MFS transporter n=1 Tax=unclassified Pseudarthrobacter TaxID=2647000 RepID=UPI002E7FD1A8|nr:MULTISPECIES: MFS transporter [unclassified Pseudarthrobacter]MEE2521254.1 MFS transporter [Pseudarthrobacter sp. J47]MEE2528486.1 MFS transporter [Pseudarthrobacter sp. J75]MEE2568178.1 MFS transporter [Pseudarthrobacter sp. J64]